MLLQGTVVAVKINHVYVLCVWFTKMRSHQASKSSTHTITPWLPKAVFFNATHLVICVASLSKKQTALGTRKLLHKT